MVTKGGRNGDHSLSAVNDDQFVSQTSDMTRHTEGPSSGIAHTASRLPTLQQRHGIRVFFCTPWPVLYRHHTVAAGVYVFHETH